MIDEPNFEVTDLRTGLPPDVRRARWDANARSRRRTLGAVLVALALLGALALPFLRVPDFSATLSQALHLPTPVPTPAPPLGANVVYVQHGLPWGALRLDGGPVTTVDTEQGYTGKELRYTSLRIPPGRHQLTYHAAPFPTLRCWISAPAAQSDTCPLAVGHARDVQPPFAAERVLDLGGDPARLALSQRAALQDATARYIATLATSATMKAGDVYADAPGAPQVASARMTATLSYVLNTDANLVFYVLGLNPRGCAILCAYQPASYLSDTTTEWVITAHVIPAWTYMQDDGSRFAGNVMPRNVGSDSFLPLAASWDGASWHVRAADVQQGTPGCLVAFTAVSAFDIPGAPLASLTMISAPTPAQGCLVIGNAPNTGGTTSAMFTLMYRFGVLFAVDNGARRLLPDIPRADALLQGLARAWAS